MIDTPVSAEVMMDPDVPVNDRDLLAIAPPSSPEMENIETVQAATIKEEREGTPLFDAIMEIYHTNAPAKQQLKQQARERSEEVKQGLVDAFIENPGATGEDARLNYEAMLELIKQQDAEAEDEDLAFVRAASGGTLDPDSEREIAFQLKTAKMMKDIWDQMSWGEVAWSGLGLLVPGNILKGNKELTGSYFDAKEYMQNFVLNFKSLPTEQQMSLLPYVKDWLAEGLGNDFKVMSVLSAIMEPGGEEGLEEFNRLWAAFDLADMSLITGTLAIKLARVRQQLNAIKMIQRAANQERAADLAAAATVDEGIRAQANVEKAEVANIVLGFNTGLDAAFAEGLSTEAVARIKRFQEMAAKTSESISGTDFVLKEGFLQKMERAAAETKYQRSLEEAGAENIRIVSRDNVSTTFEYEERVLMLGGDDIFMPETLMPQVQTVKKTGTLNLQLDDVGLYEQTEVGVLSKWFGSPTVWAKGNLASDVSAAIRADSEQAKIFKHLTELHHIATKEILGPLGLKGINPKSRRKLAQLDEVLRVGDELEETYTVYELKAGVNGIKLDDQQIEAYYKIRSLMDNLFFLRNAEERNAKVIKGLKEIRLDENVVALGRPIDDANGARLSLHNARPEIVWNMETQAFERTAGLDVADIYANGQKVVRFEQAVKVPGTEEKVNFAIVRATDVHPLPQVVLHYRPGYIPKVNLDANYFVKEFLPTRIDGRDIKATDSGAEVVTLRMFDNKRDANKWIEQFEGSNRVIRVVADRQLEMERRASLVDGPKSGGYGLYTGPRATETIPFGLEGSEPLRLSTFESISRNIAAVSRHITRNEHRMGMEQRLVNTANHLMPGQNFKSYSDLYRVPDTEAGRFIRKVADTLDEWMGMPSKEEQLWSATMQAIYERVAGLPGSSGIAWAKTKDPIAGARAASFNLLLGWGNLAQIIVQGSGAMVAASMNMFRPVELARVMKQQSVLAAADWTTSPTQLAHIAKAAGMKVDELEEMMRVWRMTGLREGILTTADHAAIVSGKGLGMDMLSRSAEFMRFGYNIGELFNRRVSFVTAYREWQAKNPGKMAGADDMKAILTRTNDFMMNLHKANRAQWQKGVLGLTTQFLQIATKFAETATNANGKFTGAERAKMISAQVALYGAAGVPLGGFLLGALAGQAGLSQADIEKMDPELVKGLNEGIAGWLTLAVFGVDVDIAPRVSLVRSISDYTDKFLFEDSTMAEMLLGPFGSVAGRFWDAFSKTWDTTSLGKAETRQFDLMQAMTDISHAASTWNNTSKAWFMHKYGMVLDRAGKPIISRDFTTMEKIAQAIGFQSSDVVRAYTLSELNHSKEQYRADVVNTIVEVMWDYSFKMHNKQMNEEEAERTRRKLAILMQSFSTPREQMLARQEVQRRLTEGTDKYSKEWRRYRELWNDGAVGELMTMRQRLTSRGLLQQGLPEFNKEWQKEMNQ